MDMDNKLKISVVRIVSLALVCMCVVCGTVSSQSQTEWKDGNDRVIGTSDSRLATTVIDSHDGITLQVTGVGEMRFDVLEYAFFIKHGEFVLSDKTFNLEIPFSNGNIESNWQYFKDNIDIAPELNSPDLDTEFNLDESRYRIAGRVFLPSLSTISGMDALKVSISDGRFDKFFTINPGEMRVIFTCYFKKLNPGRALQPDDIGIGVNTNRTAGVFCPAWGISGYALSYTDMPQEHLGVIVHPELFCYRSPCSVKMSAVGSVTSTTATLNGSFKRGDMLPTNELLTGLDSPPAYDNRYDGFLDWDSIIGKGFIYTTNNVNLRVSQYTDILYINDVGYSFPDATEIAAGTFTRGNTAFNVFYEDNHDGAQSVNYTGNISGLEPDETYYVWAFINYVFQKSNVYHAMSNRAVITTECPAVTITPSSDMLTCTIQSITLKANVTSVDENYTCSWGANADTTITTPGTYTVIVTGSNGCTKEESITINANQSLPNITVNSPSICKGDNATITASGADTYIWTPAPGLNATTEASVTVNPEVSTNYIVEGTITSTGCKNSATANVYVEAPLILTLSAPEDRAKEITVTVSAAGPDHGDYEWFIDNEFYQTTTVNSITIEPVAGRHEIRVETRTTELNCFASSELFYIFTTDISTPVAESNKNVVVYPNPFTDKLTVLVKNAKIVDIALYSAGGNLLATCRNLNEAHIATSHMPAGIYVVKVTADGRNEAVTVIKD